MELWQDMVCPTKARDSNLSLFKKKMWGRWSKIAKGYFKVQMIQTEQLTKIKKLTDIKKLHRKESPSQPDLSKKATEPKRQAFGTRLRKTKQAFWSVQPRLDSMFKISWTTSMTLLTIWNRPKTSLTFQRYLSLTRAIPLMLASIEVNSTSHLLLIKMLRSIFREAQNQIFCQRFILGLKSAMPSSKNQWWTYFCSQTS